MTEPINSSGQQFDPQSGRQSDSQSDSHFSKHDKRKFLAPRAKYRGKFTPEHLAFNANLQEFAHQVSLLCNLETGGKISPNDTYQEIKKLWKELQTSKRNLLNQEEIGKGE